MNIGYRYIAVCTRMCSAENMYVYNAVMQKSTSRHSDISGANTMNIVIIDTDQIHDWNGFHEYFATIFGFPDFYGKNMDAWIDCMSSLDRPEHNMSRIHVKPGNILVLQCTNMGDLARRHRDIYEEIIACSALVNYRRLLLGESALLTLSFYL